MSKEGGKIQLSGTGKFLKRSAEKPHLLGMSNTTNKLLSILIPSRERFDKLLACVGMFVEQLSPEERAFTELIIKLDSDDHASIARIPELPFREIEIHVYIADKLQGYRDLYIFYNQCARLSKGRYLMMWNDDATFKTRGWFGRMLTEIQATPGAASYWFGGTPTLVYVPGEQPREEDWPCFIAHHRLFYEIMGFYAHVGGVDSFLYYVLGPLGLLRKIEDIHVDHAAWFQIPEGERDSTARNNAGEGQMLPTDFNVVRQCQERIRRFAERQNAQQQQ